MYSVFHISILVLSLRINHFDLVLAFNWLCRLQMGRAENLFIS